MASISIQFHATSAELHDFLRAWLGSFELHCAAVRYQPYEVRGLDKERLGDAFGEGVRRLVFSEAKLDIEVKGNNELLDRNPGVLILELGALRKEGLTESHLSTRVATPTWQAIAREVRRATTSGAVAVNESTGATALMKNHRYTDGARDLWKTGVRMLTAGTSVMRFG